MNKRLNNRHHMIRAVVTFLNENEETFKDQAQYANLLADLRKKAEELEALRTELTILKVPFSTRKALARQTFEYALSCLNRMLIDHAELTRDNHLMATASEVRPRIKMANFSKAMDAAGIVLQLAADHLSAIKGMSRGEEVYNEAVAAQDQYAQYGAKGSYRRNAAKELNARFVAAQDDCIAYIRGPVYTFLFTWSVAYPELFAQFKIHLVIPDYGSRRAKSAEDGEGANAAATAEADTTDGTAADNGAEPVAAEAGDGETAVPAEDPSV